VVEGTFDEDEGDVAEVFGEEDEGDEPNESDGGMLDDVLCSTEVDLGVGVVNGGEFDGLEEDSGGAVGVAEVVSAPEALGGEASGARGCFLRR